MGNLARLIILLVSLVFADLDGLSSLVGFYSKLAAAVLAFVGLAMLEKRASPYLRKACKGHRDFTDRTEHLTITRSPPRAGSVKVLKAKTVAERQVGESTIQNQSSTKTVNDF